MNTRTSIGGQLSARRRSLGLRLRDLAKRTGKNPARLSELENGKSNSTIDILDEVGKALGLTLMFVPNEKAGDVQAIIAEHGHESPPAYDLTSVFDDVFIDDTRDDDEEQAGAHR